MFGPTGSAQNLTISNIDTWRNGDYSSATSISSGEAVTVIIHKIRNRADDADWVIGTVLMDAEAVPV